MTRVWRVFAVIAAAAVSLAVVGSVLAQGAPPVPPHKFFGSADTGSAAVVDGEEAADGTMVTAWNENDEGVGEATITNGTWVIDVDTAMASEVRFKIGDAVSEAFAVESGSFSEIALDLSSGAAPPSDGGAPGGLPNTGSGGLADSGSSVPVLPLALLAVAVLAVSGVAVTRRAQR